MLRNRLDLARTRDDKRQWVQDRRARTRHLIELGGLVQKAGLVELVDDDRATLLGAFLEITERLREQEEQHQGRKAGDLLLRWRRRGLRVFDADRIAAAEAGVREAGMGEEGRPGGQSTSQIAGAGLMDPDAPQAPLNRDQTP